jgi:hypothetical protein
MIGWYHQSSAPAPMVTPLSQLGTSLSAGLTAGFAFGTKPVMAAVAGASRVAAVGVVIGCNAGIEEEVAAGAATTGAGAGADTTTGTGALAEGTGGGVGAGATTVDVEAAGGTVTGLPGLAAGGACAAAGAA